MFLGHYGAALAAKRAAPGTSLGALVLGAQLVDLVWPVLLLAGVEEVRIVPGLMEASALDFVHYPWSHSLLMVGVWAGLLGGGWLLLRRDRRGALVVGALVVSHWLLDLPVHRPDLPLAPGGDTRLGGGLWDSLAATLTLEAVLLGAGVALYLSSTRARDRTGRWGFWLGIALLAGFFLGSFSAPPPSETALAVGGLLLWGFVAWGWWVDRHREARGGAASPRR